MAIPFRQFISSRSLVLSSETSVLSFSFCLVLAYTPVPRIVYINTPKLLAPIDQSQQSTIVLDIRDGTGNERPL
jgi:hypothetical protein